MFIKTLQTGTQIFSPPDFESLKPADLRLQLKSFIEESWGTWLHMYLSSVL